MGTLVFVTRGMKNIWALSTQVKTGTCVSYPWVVPVNTGKHFRKSDGYLVLYLLPVLCLMPVSQSASTISIKFYACAVL